MRLQPGGINLTEALGKDKFHAAETIKLTIH
jgi:hypothetical protein